MKSGFDFSVFDQDGDDEVQELFTGTVTMVPSNDTLKAKLLATFSQTTTKKGFYSLAPTLSFCCTIPYDSAVFEVVAAGNVDELVHMMNEGLAAVTDCDPEGRSLLSV